MRHKFLITRKQMLAADIFGYSYSNYEDHLGNIRFDRLMPSDVDALEKAEREGWNVSRLAQALEIPEDRVAYFQRAYREAKEILDAPTLAESFRRGVRFSIQHAVEQGLEDKGSIERLVTQVCYRAADLGFRLDMEGQRLSEYLDELRQESEFDAEYRQEQIRAMQRRIDQDEEKKAG